MAVRFRCSGAASGNGPGRAGARTPAAGSAIFSRATAGVLPFFRVRRAGWAEGIRGPQYCADPTHGRHAKLEVPATPVLLCDRLFLDGWTVCDAGSFGAEHLDATSYLLARLHVALHLGRPVQEHDVRLPRPRAVQDPASPPPVDAEAMVRAWLGCKPGYPAQRVRRLFPTAGRLLALWDWTPPTERVHLWRQLYLMQHVRSSHEYMAFLNHMPSHFIDAARPCLRSLRRMHRPLPEALLWPAPRDAPALRAQYVRLFQYAHLVRRLPLPGALVVGLNLLEMEGLRRFMEDDECAAHAAHLQQLDEPTVRLALARLALGAHWLADRAASAWADRVELLPVHASGPPMPPDLAVLVQSGAPCDVAPLDVFVRKCLANRVRVFPLRLLVNSAMLRADLDLRLHEAMGDFADAFARRALWRDHRTLEGPHAMAILLSVEALRGEKNALEEAQRLADERGEWLCRT